MNDKGQAGTATATTPAPKTMFKEIEQAENVARGHVEVIEILLYDPTKQKRRHIPEKDGLPGEIMTDKDGTTLYVESSRGPFFCQDPEDAMILEENNPKARAETFTVQVRKSTAIRYINAPENMKQFERKV